MDDAAANDYNATAAFGKNAAVNIENISVADNENNDAANMKNIAVANNDNNDAVNIENIDVADNENNAAANYENVGAHNSGDTPKYLMQMVVAVLVFFFCFGLFGAIAFILARKYFRT